MIKKLQYIQLLRAIGSMLVVGFHGRALLNGIFGIQLGEILFKRGSVGVSFFFMLSGFIVVWTTRNIDLSNSFKAGINFFIKRVTRFIPMYYILTFLWIICFFTISNFFHGEGLIRLIKSLLFLPDNQRPVLFVGWTLNFEVFFALIFSISLFFKKNRFWVLFIIYIIILILRQFDWTSDYMKMVTRPVMDYFMIGVLSALIIPKLKLSKIQIIIFSIVSIICFFITYFEFFILTNQITAILVLGSFVLMFLMWDFYPNSPNLNSHLIKLGDISFSMYLFHSFIFVIFQKMIPNINSLNDWVRLGLFILQFIIIILCSYFIYTYVEKKIIIIRRIKKI